MIRELQESYSAIRERMLGNDELADGALTLSAKAVGGLFPEPEDPTLRRAAEAMLALGWVEKYRDHIGTHYRVRNDFLALETRRAKARRRQRRLREEARGAE